MKKERKDHQFIKKPYYEGGMTALKNFIKKNLTYPPIALQQKIEGSVYIRYTINYKGKVIDAKIIAGVGYGCDEEAIRLVKLLQFNVPRNRNLKAVFHKNLQIHFRLPKKTVQKKEINSQPPPMTIQYNYTTVKQETDKPTKKKIEKGGSYDITIRF